MSVSFQVLPASCIRLDQYPRQMSWCAGRQRLHLRVETRHFFIISRRRSWTTGSSWRATNSDEIAVAVSVVTKLSFDQRIINAP